MQTYLSLFKRVGKKDKKVNGNKIDADRVLKEIERIAFYDLAAHIPDGKITGPDDLKKLPEDLRRAIIGWRWDKSGNFIVLWADKVKGLELYGRHLKLFTDKVEATGANGTPLNPTPPTPVVIWPEWSDIPLLPESLLDAAEDFMRANKRLGYRDWETDRKSTRLNSSHSGESRMPSSA